MSITYDQEPPVSIPDLEVEPAPSAEAEPKLAPAQEMAAAWRNFCELYLTFDRRTLGLTRILLGFYLIFDLFRRTSD